MNTQKFVSTAAQCAKLTRSILKENFPKIKFQVRCENYAGGDSVRVDYTDGVIEEDVKKLTEYRLQYGHFNGMTDYYEYDNDNETLPQVKYFFVNRHISEQARVNAIEELKKNYGIEVWDDQHVYEKTYRWTDQILWDYFKNKAL